MTEPTKEHRKTAAELVSRFSWTSNVMRNGRLVGMQYIVADDIAQALAAEAHKAALEAEKQIATLRKMLEDEQAAHDILNNTVRMEQLRTVGAEARVAEMRHIFRAIAPEMRREHDSGDGHFSTALVEAVEKFTRSFPSGDRFMALLRAVKTALCMGDIQEALAAFEPEERS